MSSSNNTGGFWEEFFSHEFYNYSEMHRMYGQGTGPVFLLVLAPFLYCLLGIPGILLNTFIVYVSARSKLLNGTSNFLIAVTSALEVLHQSAHFLELWVAVSGQNFITFSQQVRLQLHSVFALNVVHWVMALTAVDRLLYVTMPILHRDIDFSRRKKTLFLAGPLFLCFLYGIFVCSVYLSTAEAHADMPTSGSLADIQQFQSGYLFGQNVFISAVIGLCCYAAVWRLLRKKSAEVQEQNRLFRSLLLVMLADTFGYAIGIGLTCVNIYLVNGNRPTAAWMFQIPINMVINLAPAGSGIVLFNNSEYRKEFAHYGGPLMRFIVAKIEGQLNTPVNSLI